MTDQPYQPDLSTADGDALELTITFSYEPEGTAQDLFGISEETLLDVAGAVLERVNIGESVEISVLVSDDAGIQQLNRDYRGRDETTDVLSFPLLDAPIVDAPADELWSTDHSNDTGDDTGDLAETADLDALLAGLHTSLATEAKTGAADATDWESGESGADLSADSASIFVVEESDDENTLLIVDEEGDDGGDDEIWPLHLGDIALSRDAVIRQAQQAGHSAAWECAYLVAHSVLHLVGYDDQTEAGFHAMVAHQEAALAEIGVPR